MNHLEQSPELDFSRFLRFILKKTVDYLRMNWQRRIWKWVGFFFEKHLGFSVFKSIISCKWKSIFNRWPIKSSMDSGFWALLLIVSILFFLQLLLSNAGWQFPPVLQTWQVIPWSPWGVRPAFPGKMSHCVGEGTLKEQVTREMQV